MRTPGDNSPWGHMRIGRLAAVVVTLVTLPFWDLRAIPASPFPGASRPLPGLPVPKKPAVPAVLEGLVTTVPDGDTLTLVDGEQRSHRIRLLGIDAPEEGQACGPEARQALLIRTLRKTVRVHTTSRDPYGRLVGKVMLDGRDVNLDMVRAGWAWHYKAFSGSQFPGDARIYGEAEREARTTQRGLWAQGHPEAPWTWRKRHRRI